ncbi:peptidylprolyl isomerase, partial [Salmonella enterica subsp. enterica serovar Poona]|nr:peptidylprolyl isomerase [Salmonella enterica subsp. enterica serovar Poona]EEO3567726.1 peptidylprolyl isomerase [Salmonella enterica subsp. enterica serovar Poona]
KASAQQTYAAGVMLGRDILNLQVAQQKLGLKTDNRILVAGIRDALNRKVLLNEPALDTALREAESVARKARLAVIREQKKAGSLYLEKFRKHKDVKQAESGFWYRTEYAGDGGFIRGDDTIVDVVVTEKLTDGTVVEDMDARGQVISQPLGDYPALFRSALTLMKNHGTVELVVPSDLAYGDGGYPPKVPPGATMVYTLRVEDVKAAAELPGTEGGSKKEAEPAGTRDKEKAGRTEGVKK